MPIKDDDLGRQLRYLHILARSAAPSGQLLPDLEFGQLQPAARPPARISLTGGSPGRAHGRLPTTRPAPGTASGVGLHESWPPESSTDLAALRRGSADRAPDGGRWFPWAMEHPDGSVSIDEAKERDIRAGSAEAYLEPID